MFLQREHLIRIATILLGPRSYEVRITEFRNMSYQYSVLIAAPLSTTITLYGE